MKTLQYSFAQIEAFATIAETGSLSRAAIRLGKDRTTLRDLLDYLEDALGYHLFSREGRTLTLTDEGEQLFRQAHLLLRQAQAFESFAQTLPQTTGQALRLVYDPFIPRDFLCALADTLARLQISGHTLYMNEITLLRHALEQGRGWGFLPDHLRPGEWQGVSEIATEVGSQGLNVTMVMLWLPGMNKHRMLSDIVDKAPELWRRG
ncbi:TPA: LysR family transcriptional regulator [Klebsiella quasipneumoniae]